MAKCPKASRHEHPYDLFGHDRKFLKHQGSRQRVQCSTRRGMSTGIEARTSAGNGSPDAANPADSVEAAAPAVSTDAEATTDTSATGSALSRREMLMIGATGAAAFATGGSRPGGWPRCTGGRVRVRGGHAVSRLRAPRHRGHRRGPQAARHQADTGARADPGLVRLLYRHHERARRLSATDADDPESLRHGHRRSRRRAGTASAGRRPRARVRNALVRPVPSMPDRDA